MITTLEFEKPILELEKKIGELKNLSSDSSLNLQSEVKKLESRLEHVKKETYHQMSAWQRVQIARHPKRPYALDYIQMIFTDFIEFHGDRTFADDKALVGGFGKLDGQTFLILGHQKGRDAKENIMRNFGSAHPEGYRKALRLIRMAEKFKIPVVALIDTPGAYPGVGAEERGQASAIAFNIREMSLIQTPIFVVVIGEGGSGGALGIGVGDRVAVLENAYYSVISPEGCAAILWKDRTKAPDAADALKLTARDLFDMGLIDEIIKEPLGGAHHDPASAAENIKTAVKKYWNQLKGQPLKSLIENRYEKFRSMGVFENVKTERKRRQKALAG